MSPTKDKIVLGSLTIILFPFLYYFIIRISQNILTDPEFFITLVGMLLAVFNLAILSGWFALGWIGGVTILGLSSILVLLLANAYAIQIFYLNILIFLASAFTGHRLTRRMLDSVQIFKTDIEKVAENHNILTSELGKHKSQNESLEKKLARYFALKDVTELFSASLSLDDTVKFMVERAHALIGKSDRTLFYLVDRKKQELALKDSMQPEGFPKIKSKKGDMFDGWVLRQKSPLSVPDADKDFRFQSGEAEEGKSGFKSLIAYPLIARKRMLGLLRMDSRKVDNFMPDDLRLLGIISDLGAVAVENAVLYGRTIELAIRDSLTNLFVHRYFRERLGAELERAYLGSWNLSLLMIDIDHFKNYNDKYGHTAGDILLKGLADIFDSLVNPGDIIARYGGEEFAILLIETRKMQARDIAEKIRESIRKKKFWLRREETRVTVSIGIATFPDEAKSENDFINIADQNLYKAKRKGRNRIC